MGRITKVNYIGNGVAATRSGETVTVTIPGGAGSWGGITGTLSNQTDLQTALNAKQATLVSATNIKTINGSSVLGSGDLTVSGSGSGSGLYPVGRNPLYGPSDVINDSFVVFGSAGLQTGYHGGGSPTLGNPIVWQFPPDAGGVPTIFFDNVETIGGNGVRFSFPPVKRLFNATFTQDEVMSSYGVTVALQWYLTGALDMYWWSPKPLNIIFTGNGAGSWTLGGNSAYFNTQLNNGYASFEINGAISSTSYAGCSMNYYGPNNYHIKQYLTGTYGGGFYLVDSGGSTVSNPTSNDIVVVNGFPIQVTTAFNMTTWDVYNLGLKILSSTHINVHAEAWILNDRQSDTTVVLTWQAYPAATAYKIYRSSSWDLSSPTLVYSGTDLTYTDTVVSGVYYYKMMAVLSGVDTYISKTISKYS